MSSQPTTAAVSASFPSTPPKLPAAARTTTPDGHTARRTSSHGLV